MDSGKGHTISEVVTAGNEMAFFVEVVLCVRIMEIRFFLFYASSLSGRTDRRVACGRVMDRDGIMLRLGGKKGRLSTLDSKPSRVKDGAHQIRLGRILGCNFLVVHTLVLPLGPR